MAKEIKTQRRSRAQVSGGLVPVTLRISAQDRDNFEHLARVHGSNLSEYLRALLDEYASKASFGHRLDDIGAQLNAISEKVHQDIEQERFPTTKSEGHTDQALHEITRQLTATTTSVEQFTTLIQSSFEQWFEAFFKLQTFLEQMSKAQGGRR